MPGCSTSLGTCVDCGGNFVMTAKSPAGPVVRPGTGYPIDGIDPSLFFDEDGQGVDPQQRPAGGQAAL